MDLEEFLELWLESEWIGEMTDPTVRVYDANLSCGDHIQFDFKIVNGVITNCLYIGKGCCLCKSAAAYLCKRSIGLTLEGADKFDLEIKPPPTPMRQKCVLLAVNTFRAGLANATSKNQGH